MGRSVFRAQWGSAQCHGEPGPKARHPSADWIRPPDGRPNPDLRRGRNRVSGSRVPQQRAVVYMDDGAYQITGDGPASGTVNYSVVADEMNVALPF